MVSLNLLILEKGACIFVLDKRIHIPAKQIEYLRPGQQPVVRLSVEAYNALTDLANESSMPLSMIASKIITEAIQNELVVLDRDGKET